MDNAKATSKQLVTTVHSCFLMSIVLSIVVAFIKSETSNHSLHKQRTISVVFKYFKTSSLKETHLNSIKGKQGKIKNIILVFLL